MHQNYADILSRIADRPQWFDEQGVPRYCIFHPREISNIYATEVALIEIRCQACHTVFTVAIDLARADGIGMSPDRTWTGKKLADYIRDFSLEYGDPPNVDCCGTGPSETSICTRVIQYWHRHQKSYTLPGSPVRYLDMSSFDWERDTSLEIEFPEVED